MWWRHNKCNMADGRHFENGFVVISLPQIIRLRRNLACRCKVWFQERSHGKKNCKLKMADGRQFENRLLATSVLTIARLTRNFVCERRIIVGHRLHNQDNKFRKFEMVDGANMKMILSLCRPRIMGFRWYLVCLCRFWFQEWSRVTNLNNWMNEIIKTNNDNITYYRTWSSCLEAVTSAADLLPDCSCLQNIIGFSPSPSDHQYIVISHERKKTGHSAFAHIFANCWLIFKK